MAKVAAYVLRGNGLAMQVVPYMAIGAAVAGDRVTTFSDAQYTAAHLAEFDIAVFWGYVETCQAIMKGDREAGKKAVYLDLAYWRRDDHYKVSVNDRHPTAYFRKGHGDDRRKRFVGRIGPYRVRDHILIAGLSPKAAWAEKMEPVGSWELRAVAQIKSRTSRPIIYRPKPTWVNAPHIPGTIFSPATESSQAVLAKSWSVVTYHSNVGVDGLA